MRTTLTLDDNLLRKLKDLAHSQTKKFKHVVNETLSPGPAGQEKRGKRRKKFTVKPFSGGFKPGVDSEKLNQALDDLDAEDSNDRS